MQVCSADPSLARQNWRWARVFGVLQWINRRSRLIESSNPIQPEGNTFSELRVSLKAHPLTNRETEIVLLVLQGLSNKEIACACSITEQTVKDHLKHVYAKAGVHQRTALCAKIFRIDSGTAVAA